MLKVLILSELFTHERVEETGVARGKPWQWALRNRCAQLYWKENEICLFFHSDTYRRSGIWKGGRLVTSWKLCGVTAHVCHSRQTSVTVVFLSFSMPSLSLKWVVQSLEIRNLSWSFMDALSQIVSVLEGIIIIITIVTVVYVFVHVYAHEYKCVHMLVCMHACMCTCMCVYVGVGVSVCLSVCACVCVHMCVLYSMVRCLCWYFSVSISLK